MSEQQEKSNRYERHAQTLMMIVLTAVLSGFGALILESLNDLKEGVSNLETRMIEVEKKLVAVTVESKMARKTIQDHIEDDRRHQ